MASPANVAIAMVARNNTPGRTTNSQSSESEAFLSSLSQTLGIPTSITFTGVTQMTKSGLMTDSRPPPAIPSPRPSANPNSQDTSSKGLASEHVPTVTHTETAAGAPASTLTKTTTAYVGDSPHSTVPTRACNHTCSASITGSESSNGGDHGESQVPVDEKFKVYGAAIGVSLGICLLGCLLGWWFWYKRRLRRERGVRGGSISSETTVGRGMGMGMRMGYREGMGERERWWH